MKGTNLNHETLVVRASCPLDVYLITSADAVIKLNKNKIQEINNRDQPGQDLLIAKGWEREQYIGITILLVGVILIIGFFSRRFEYALIFAFTFSMILIVFLLSV